MTPQTRKQRIDAVLPRLAAWIRDEQQRSGVHGANTVLAGFSKGASLSIELAMADDALVAQVLAFSGRLPATLTPRPPRTLLHLFTGALDPLLPVEDVQASVQRFTAAGGPHSISRKT